MVGVRPLMVVEGDPAPDASLGPLQPVGPVEGCELASLISVYYLGRAELVDRLVQSLEAEVRFQRVLYPPGQNFSGEPVHDGDQIQKPLSHRKVGDFGAPDLIGPVDPKSTQQIGISLATLRGLAGVGLLVDRHQPHQAHQSSDALFVHGMAFVLQTPAHLPDTVKWSVQKLLVDLQHQVEVHRCFVSAVLTPPSCLIVKLRCGPCGDLRGRRQREPIGSAV
jgi:hypothetical protein